MPSKHKTVKDTRATSSTKYMGTVGNMPCHVCKLRGNGITDPNSNWRLWNADMNVYRDGAGQDEDDEVFDSIDDEILKKIERRRKAMLWFSIGEKLRELHLSDMGGRDKTSADVFRRIYERVAPEGTKYEPMESLGTPDITEKMRDDVRRRREMKKKEKEEVKTV
ncbi:hypothetical protein LCER1_G002122 [Lachnellula cervina]|uniref:Uncharacterized protein n=1 Tax=Lachnellula cervina TaxID=1316786 RepID=A0A7D8UU24_9HELO|nr:hypothetical protein LCER1_G002122 [Lachnellula cervina]